jgi:hypothetical protein
MTERRGFIPKTDLTPTEKIKVAYFYIVRGVAQQVLADMFEVNMGRVNEALEEVLTAVGMEDNDRGK